MPALLDSGRRVLVGSPDAMSRSLRSLFAGLGCLAVSWSGLTTSCSEDEAAALRRAGAAQGCTLNSDCASPLVCIFGRCHVQCNATVDCPAGQRCVVGANGTNVCQLPEEASCVGGATCAGQQACGPDGKCRDVCSTKEQCVAPQVCVSKLCAEQTELDDTGNLPVLSTDASAGGSGGGSGAGGTTGGGGASGSGGTQQDGSTPDLPPITDAGAAPQPVWNAGGSILGAALSGNTLVVAWKNGTSCTVEKVSTAGASLGTLADEPGTTCVSLVVGPDSAYWGIGSSVPYKVRKALLSGGPPSDFDYATTGPIGKLIAIGDQVYWLDGETVRSRGASGSSVLVTTYVRALVGATPTTIWVAKGPPGPSSSSLQRCPNQAGASCQEMFNAADGDPLGVADTEGLFWGNLYWMMRVDDSGKKTMLDSPAYPTSVFAVPEPPSEHVYYYSGLNQKVIMRSSKVSLARTLLASVPNEAVLIGVDATKLYFFEKGTPKIFSLPK